MPSAAGRKIDLDLSVDAVVFDLDGTLVDSVGDLAAALAGFLRPHGFPDFTDAAVRRWMGTDAQDIIAGLISDFAVEPRAGFDLAAAATAFLDYYDSWPHGRSAAYPGAVELLGALGTSGVKIGICTNKREALSRAILAELGLMPFVDAVAGADTTEHRKPHPAPLLHVLAEIGVRPERAMMVGDSISDVRVGRAARVALVVGADYGYPRRPADLDGADRRIAGLGDLQAMLLDRAELP